MFDRAGLCLAKRPKQPIVLSSPTGAAVAASAETVQDDTPRRKFRKDLIRVGDYNANGAALSVRKSDLDRWAAQFAQMKSNGVRVPIPVGHTDDAEAVRGYVDEMFVEGDTLFMVAEMIGADAIALAARTEVSIATDPGYTDGKGNVYSDPIVHVALTPVPVVPDQDGFIPIAASRGSKPTRARLYRLALSTENSPMEALTKIATMLGVPGIESLDEAALVDAITKHIESMHAMSKETDKKADAAAAELATIKASMSKQAEPPPAAMVRMAAENRELKLSRLVEQGRITPAVKDKLAAIWIGKDNAGLKLSLDDKGDGQFAAMIDALSENDPVELGTKTVAQGVALSNGKKDEAIDGKKAGEALMATIGIKPRQ